ncbi:unnamed protein product [Haemonchus placei]|uniref:Uncharacterized protein n=1 Tax=Haemonchus placei TaxID=6290 RepID=A0A0N4WVY5_HAEPC|nr:unnamed protein product [Haemonchus placei]
MEETENREDDLDHKWEQLWPLETQANAFSTGKPMEETDENASWEKYWSLEQDDVEEFTKAESEVQSMEVRKVLENFVNTIEKKDDGYYLRLPWKEIPMKLPDNRAIALRKLISVWTSLQRDKDLLEKYNNIFQEQLRSNVIEEVIDEKEPVEGKIRYLPHQAVLTPQKNTTKIRIVFDA